MKLENFDKARSITNEIKVIMDQQNYLLHDGELRDTLSLLIVNSSGGLHPINVSSSSALAKKVMQMKVLQLEQRKFELTAAFEVID